MQALSLELAGPQDAQALLSLYQSQVGVGVSDWDGTYPTLAHIHADIAARQLYVYREAVGISCEIPLWRSIFKSAPKANRIIAAVSLLDDDDLNTLTCWTPGRPAILCRLCVDIARQGQGLAGRVVAAAESIALSRGRSCMRLLCAQSNPAARRVYIRGGYEHRGNCFLYETDFDCFEKILTKG